MEVMSDWKSLNTDSRAESMVLRIPEKISMIEEMRFERPSRMPAMVVVVGV